MNKVCCLMTGRKNNVAICMPVFREKQKPVLEPFPTSYCPLVLLRSTPRATALSNPCARCWHVTQALALLTAVNALQNHQA